MMDMVESNEESGPPSVAEREPGLVTSHSLISCHIRPHDAPPPPIHVHYRHLLIPLHVDDCFTSSLHLVFSGPLIHRLCMVSPLVHTLTFRVSIHGQNDRLPLIIPICSPSCSSMSYLPLSSIGTTSHWGLPLLIVSSSRCSLPLATARYCTYLTPAGTHGY
jgi:hypothetical protein